MSDNAADIPPFSWTPRSFRKGNCLLIPTLWATLAVLHLGTSASRADAGSATGGSLPAPVEGRHFRALLEQSPFTRSLDLSGALVLTGVAEVDGRPVATLIDTEDGRSLAISESPDERGWKLVEFRRRDDLEVAVATIAIEGGEVFRVYYDEERVRNAVQKQRVISSSRSLQIAVRTRTFTLPDWINQIEDPQARGQAIAKLIEQGAFDAAPLEAVDMALSQSNPQTRGPVLSAAFGRLGGGVGGVEYRAAVSRLNSLENGRDRDFAINGLAHGLAGRDPKGALNWAKSISNEGFRKVVVENVTRRIERQ